MGVIYGMCFSSSMCDLCTGYYFDICNIMLTFIVVPYVKEDNDSNV